MTPTEAEWDAARRALAASMRRASIAEIGGFRPAETCETSWWGGNFLAARHEGIPVCAQTGRAMHPVLQIRLDELPYRPAALADLALIAIWFDLDTDLWWDAPNGSGFCLRSYAGLDGLVPLGPSMRLQDGKLPVLPVRWHLTEADGPTWEDIDIPPNVARQDDASWFHDNNNANLQTKVGGWPTWAQGSQGKQGFMLQLDSEPQGGLSWGDVGHVFFFLEDGRWRIVGDCY